MITASQLPLGREGKQLEACQSTLQVTRKDEVFLDTMEQDVFKKELRQNAYKEEEEYQI